MIEHNIVPCKPPWEELGECTTCGAAEGELLSSCPGYRLNYETKEACYTGNVCDLEGWRTKFACERRRSRRG